MSDMFRYREEIDLQKIVDEQARKLQRNVDEATLDKAAGTLASFGYVKVVRCRDCAYCMAYMAGTYCDYMAHSVEPDGFCAWAERKEGE